MMTVPTDQAIRCHIPQESYIQNHNRVSRDFRTVPAGLLAAVIRYVKAPRD
jgi:hypothetical protein